MGLTMEGIRAAVSKARSLELIKDNNDPGNSTKGTKGRPKKLFERLPNNGFTAVNVKSGSVAINRAVGDPCLVEVNPQEKSINIWGLGIASGRESQSIVVRDELPSTLAKLREVALLPSRELNAQDADDYRVCFQVLQDFVEIYGKNGKS